MLSRRRRKRKGRAAGGPLQVADHEKSVTNHVGYGGGLGHRPTVMDDSGPNKGIYLGPKGGFNTLEDADRYARARSEQGHSKKKRKGRTTYYPNTTR